MVDSRKKGKKRKTSQSKSLGSASGSAPAEEEHWWGAEVKTLAISLDTSHLAECSIVYEAYGDEYGESAAIVRFMPEFVLYHPDTDTHHEWRYAIDAPARSGPDADWDPQSQSPPSKKPQPANVETNSRRFTALEEQVALHQPQISRIEETIAHMRLEMRNQKVDRFSTNALDTLLGLMRYKLIMQSRKVPKKPTKAERVISDGDNGDGDNGGSTSPSNPASERVGDLNRTVMVLEFDCTSVLFAAFARKLHMQFSTAQVCENNRIVFHPSFRATQDHASNASGFRIFVPSIVHIAAAAGIGKSTDLHPLIYRTVTRKIKTADPENEVTTTSEVFDLRISGSYAYERGDPSKSCHFLPGASFPSRSPRDLYIASRNSRALLSLARASRRMDWSTGTFEEIMKPRLVDRPTDMFCEEDNINPLRLDRFYFQWKPLADIPAGYTKDVADSVNTHGKLIINCPYVHVFGKEHISDITSALTTEVLDFILGFFRE